MHFTMHIQHTPGNMHPFKLQYLQSRNLFGVLKLECIREGDETAIYTHV